MEKNWTQSLWWNLCSKKEIFCTRGRCVHRHHVFSVEREKFSTQNLDSNFYCSVWLKCPFWTQKFRHRHSKLVPLFCRLCVFSAFLWLQQEAAEGNGRGGVCRWISREVLCCTNNSQVTSAVSGTSCGPMWADTTTALLMVKQCTAGLCFAWWATGKQHSRVSVGHIIPIVRAGFEMWPDVQIPPGQGLQNHFREQDLLWQLLL